MPREIVKLVPNVPIEIALAFPAGKIVNGTYGDQVMFGLDGNRVIYLDLGPAQQINDLHVTPGETFSVVKRWTGKKTDKSEFDCWLSTATEKARAAREMRDAPPETPLEAQLQASVKWVERKAPAVSPVQTVAARGTGTYGPMAAVAPAVRQLPTKRQYAEAFAAFLIDAGRATRSAEIALGSDGGSVRFDSRDLAAIATSMFIAADKAGYLTWDGGAR
jgi:hypothetical protein